MKTRLAILIVLVALASATATAAFAAKGSSNERSGNLGAPPDPATYINWSSVEDEGDNPPSTSPHGNYLTMTVKCQVCHSVHQAAPDGDTLLRMNAEEACAFCHVSTDHAVPGSVVYGGNILIAQAGGDDHHTVFAGGSNIMCSRCHASVHGSDAVSDIPSVAGLLLLEAAPNNTAGGPNPADAATFINNREGAIVTGVTAADLQTDPTLRQAAIGLWCSGCHSGSYQLALPNYAANRVGAARSGHRVMAAVTTDWNAGGDISTGRRDIGQIAWAPAYGCVDCHDAENGIDGNTGFPHYTPGASRFLTGAAYLGAATETTVGAPAAEHQTVIGPGGHTSGGINRWAAMVDGTCLKCHRGSATTGVGFDY